MDDVYSSLCSVPSERLTSTTVEHKERSTSIRHRRDVRERKRRRLSLAICICSLLLHSSGSLHANDGCGNELREPARSNLVSKRLPNPSSKTMNQISENDWVETVDLDQLMCFPVATLENHSNPLGIEKGSEYPTTLNFVFEPTREVSTKDATNTLTTAKLPPIDHAAEAEALLPPIASTSNAASGKNSDAMPTVSEAASNAGVSNHAQDTTPPIWNVYITNPAPPVGPPVTTIQPAPISIYNVPPTPEPKVDEALQRRKEIAAMGQ